MDGAGIPPVLGLERVKDNQAGNEKMIEVEKDELKKGGGEKTQFFLRKGIEGRGVTKSSKQWRKYQGTTIRMYPQRHPTS